MTAQQPDEVFFEGQGYAVTAVDGAGLFDPATHGLEPRAISTGCYRGYVCRYAVVEQRLVLRDLELGSGGEPPRSAMSSRDGTTGTRHGTIGGWTSRWRSPGVC